jgi:hypothetical protein
LTRQEEKVHFFISFSHAGMTPVEPLFVAALTLMCQLRRRSSDMTYAKIKVRTRTNFQQKSAVLWSATGEVET